MENKHTAGQWIVANSGGTVIVHNGTRYQRIALLENSPLSITKEVEANAKLIAAAPIMLNAIDETSNRIAYCIDLYNIPDEAIAMLRGEIDNLLSVIKTATV